jgi:ABC-2 type transport system ATP-binding protein
MLEVQQLTKLYGRRIAVDEVTFNVSAGEIVGYLGPNGAGKSTTVKMLVALLQPSAGQILFRGRPIQDCLLDFKQRLGYVPEEAILYSHLSGYEFLLLVGRLRGIRESALIQKIESLLKVCLLNPYKHSPIASYSKGMKQKIMMLAALLHDPDVLVLDEPFSGLDVSSILIFRRLLRSLAAAGKAILLSSHDLEITEKICSRVLVIYKSRLVANDSVENLRHTMKLSSLEEVFQQLVEQEDYDKAADEILSIVHA